MMNDGRTTAAVQRYLDDLVGVCSDTASEQVVRALLARSVDRLHLLCAGMLHRRYPRLVRGPANVRSQELLSAVVERLIKAMRQVRPATVKQFFGLANRHMRWELNELARQLDHQQVTVELQNTVAGPADAPPNEPSVGSAASITVDRILRAIEGLPEDEREVFSLVRIQGMSQAGAADVLGVSLKTAQRRLHRALAMLIEALPDLEPSPNPAPEKPVGSP